jgi:dimethylhistidine N-methyltransferase
MKTPRLLQFAHDDPAATRAEIFTGFSASTATIAPKYFYDALGSRLFSAITELPEYYPTRTEAGIFARYAPEMADALAPVASLVDLGAGNCEKAASLFDPLRVQRYAAVDISAGYLRDSLECLQRKHPAMDLLGIGLDFSQRLDLPVEVGAGPHTLFYPGSSIGNFTPDEALAFLRQAHAASAGGALLIGVDLVKPVAVLEKAYDDPLGITAAFNRNLLRHLNAMVGSNFVIEDWRHVAFFNTGESRIEMHLEAVCETVLHWPGGERRFAAGERIHTENSYKWQADDFAALLAAAGFSRLRRWTDERGWFAVFLARA